MCLGVLQPHHDINHGLVKEIPKYLIYFRIHFCTASSDDLPADNGSKSGQIDICLRFKDSQSSIKAFRSETDEKIQHVALALGEE